MSSGLEEPVELMNSQHLLFPVQDRASKHSRTDGGGAHELPSLLRNYQQLMAAKEGVGQFSFSISSLCIQIVYTVKIN